MEKNVLDLMKIHCGDDFLTYHTHEDNSIIVYVSEILQYIDKLQSINANRFKFDKTYCSQCGQEFGPGDHGFSHCDNHKTAAQLLAERKELQAQIDDLESALRGERYKNSSLENYKNTVKEICKEQKAELESVRTTGNVRIAELEKANDKLHERIQFLEKRDKQGDSAICELQGHVRDNNEIIQHQALVNMQLSQKLAAEQRRARTINADKARDEDATRYRYLRSLSMNAMYTGLVFAGMRPRTGDSHVHGVVGVELDKAVDFAIQADDEIPF